MFSHPIVKHFTVLAFPVVLLSLFFCCCCVCQNAVTMYLEAYLNASLKNTCFTKTRDVCPLSAFENIVLWPLTDDQWVLQRWYKIILDRVTWDEDFKLAFANVSSFIGCNVANTVFTSGKSLPRVLSIVCYVRYKFGVICGRGCCPHHSSPRGTPVSRFEDIRRALWKRRPWNVFGLKKLDNRNQKIEKIICLGEEKETKDD